jgi:ribosomal protein S18 acetylase RimI-like enzyme
VTTAFSARFSRARFGAPTEMEPKNGPQAPAEGAETTDAILRFMESIGHRSEAEFYLALFRAESKESFANLVIGASVLRDAAEAVVLDLRFLRGLGLVPVVSLGLSSAGPVSAEQSERLQRRLERADVPSTAFLADSPRLAEQVTETARGGIIPIVAFTSGDANDAGAKFDALGDLSERLRTRKLIFVARGGGLRLRQSDSDLPIINLATEYENLVQKRLLPRKRLLLLEQARRLLVEKTTHRMFVAVTSPLLLLRELFTIRGAGTLIKRGSPVLVKNGFAEVDQPRLAALLQSSFARDLLPGFFDRDIARIYVEENYRGAALVRETPLGAYLCKLAVEREAQGEGLGRDLWQLVVSDYKSLFWRARPDNEILPFYLQECDGMARAGDWHVFWKGLETSRIPEAIATALAQPIDFAAP